MTTWTPQAIMALKSRLGLSYAGLAKECGVNPRTVRYWTSQTRPVEPGGSAKLHLDRLNRKRSIPAPNESAGKHRS